MEATIEAPKTTPAAPAKIHTRTWSGSSSAAITDMTNAGKRGKTCRTIHFQGWLNGRMEEPYRTISDFTYFTVDWIGKLPLETDYDTAAAELRKRIEDFAATMQGNESLIRSIQIREDEIKGIDAPRSTLSAGIEGQWNARADNSGLCINDETDPNNMPAAITHNQTDAQAYKLAAKVWDKVKDAKTFREACNILGEAGCRLHYYCRMD